MKVQVRRFGQKRPLHFQTGLASGHPNVSASNSRRINIATYRGNQRGYFHPVPLAETSTTGIRIISQREMGIGDLFLADLSPIGGVMMIYHVTSCPTVANAHSVCAALWSTSPSLKGIELEKKPVPA
jgi:hypothetical protein